MEKKIDLNLSLYNMFILIDRYAWIIDNDTILYHDDNGDGVLRSPASILNEIKETSNGSDLDLGIILQLYKVDYTPNLEYYVTIPKKYMESAGYVIIDTDALTKEK